ncbi:hypothetical protein [Acrocarpospora pleiomorpha]|uniref:hypothetical protein n=1 Tax=Acrocarpospora pleiomorpha TaxID=90975 RepID=UPI0012D2EBFF|nr:hypothetical protein [Acrocarpospora pleiomorpha]
MPTTAATDLLGADMDLGEERDSGPAPVDDPVFTPPYRALKEHGPFANFQDFVEFTEENSALTERLLNGLNNPYSDDGKVASYWLAQARRVVPSAPLSIGQHLEKSETLWKALGKTLNVAATSRGEILAELYWTTSREPGRTDLTLSRLQSWTGKIGVREAFDAKLAELHDAQWLPNNTGSVEMASMEGLGYPEYGKAQSAAKDTMTARLDALKRQLLRQHGSHAAWMAQLGSDPALKDERALDRVADVLTTLRGDRVCVSLLHRGREIGVFANRPDQDLGRDLEALLRASRAVGHKAEEEVQALLDTIAARQPTTSKPQLLESRTRAEIRIRKAIAYLRTLEQTEGRIRVVAYNGSLPQAKNGTEQKVHAEMQALAVAREAPGSYKLGVGRACCLKCFLVLNDVYPDVFQRTLATHMKVYPWPPPAVLRDEDTLRRMMGDDLPLAGQKALKSIGGRGALAGGIAFSGLEPQGTRSVDPTGYASSQETPSDLPSSPVWQDLDEDDQELIQALDEYESYQAYLDSDVALTAAEARQERGDQGPPTVTTPPVQTSPGITSPVGTSMRITSPVARSSVDREQSRTSMKGLGLAQTTPRSIAPRTPPTVRPTSTRTGGDQGDDDTPTRTSGNGSPLRKRLRKKKSSQ